MITLTVCEGTDNCHAVCQLCQLWECCTEGNAEERRFDFAVNAANVGRRCHFWIEGLDLTRSAREKQHHDRLVFHGPALRFDGRLCFQQAGQCKTSQCERSDLQEFAPI